MFVFTDVAQAFQDFQAPCHDQSGCISAPSPWPKALQIPMQPWLFEYRKTETVKEPTLHEQFFPQLIFAWWTRGKQERVTYINISHLPAMGC